MNYIFRNTRSVRVWAKHACLRWRLVLCVLCVWMGVGVGVGVRACVCMCVCAHIVCLLPISSSA